MSITSLQVQTLAATLGAELLSATSFDVLFLEELAALGHDPRGWMSTVVDGGALPTTQTVTLPTTINIIALQAVFLGGRELSPAAAEELAAWAYDWRDRRGDPLVYALHDESDRTLRLYPESTRTYDVADDGRPLFLCTSTNTAGIPDILKLPLALLVIAREFERESTHRDLDFAGICRALGQHVLSLVF